MDLYIGEELEFVGLQGLDDLGFEIGGGTSLGDDVRAEDLHLLLGEVCVGKDCLDFYQAGVELLV